MAHAISGTGCRRLRAGCAGTMSAPHQLEDVDHPMRVGLIPTWVSNRSTRRDTGGHQEKRRGGDICRDIDSGGRKRTAAVQEITRPRTAPRSQSRAACARCGPGWGQARSPRWCRWRKARQQHAGLHLRTGHGQVVANATQRPVAADPQRRTVPAAPCICAPIKVSGAIAAPWAGRAGVIAG